MPAQAGALLPLRLSPPLARTPRIPFMMKGFFQTERKKFSTLWFQIFSPSQIRERRLTLFSPNSRSAEICCWIITKERGYVFKEKKWLMVFCIILTFFLALVYTEWLWTLSSIEIFLILFIPSKEQLWFGSIEAFLGGHMLFKNYFPPLVRAAASPGS